MKTKQAIERLDEMQSQIIHGKRTFGEIADIIRDAEQALNDAGVATGNAHQEYSLAERIKWMAAGRDSFMRQVDKLREEPTNRKCLIDHRHIKIGLKCPGCDTVVC